MKTTKLILRITLSHLNRPIREDNQVREKKSKDRKINVDNTK